MACYIAIAIAATLTLEGQLLWVVWIALAGMALKTYLATLREP